MDEEIGADCLTDRENSLFWHQEIFNWINYWTGKIDSLDGNAITQ